MGNCVLSFFPFLFLVTFEDIFNHATETSQSITFLDILIKSPQKTKPITKYPLITFCVCAFFGFKLLLQKHILHWKKTYGFFKFFSPKKKTFHKMAKFCHNTFTASSSIFIFLYCYYYYYYYYFGGQNFASW